MFKSCFQHLFLLIIIFLSNFKAFSQDSANISIPVQKEAIDFPIDYQAQDSIIMDLPNKLVHLYGQAIVKYNSLTLSSGYILVDFNSKDLFAKALIDSNGKMYQKPIFKDGSDQFESDSLVYNFDTKKGLTYNIMTTQGEGFVYGAVNYKDEFNNIYVKNAKYTTCNDTLHPHFYIFTKKFKIIPKKQVVTGPANLVIGDVPTPLVIPFGFFPIQQGQTRGLIIPTYGESINQGFFFRGIGYYFPINQYFDLATTADFYFRGGYGIHINSNYRKRYYYNGRLSLNFSHNVLGEKEELNNRSIYNDYEVIWNYQLDPTTHQNKNFNIDINYRSPFYAANNSTNVSRITDNNIVSTINYSTNIFNKKLNISSSARLSQNLQKKDVDLLLPNINFSIQRVMPFASKMINNDLVQNFGFSYSSTLNNSVTIKQENLFKQFNTDSIPVNRPFWRGTVIDSLQNSWIHSIPISTSFQFLKYLNITPNANFSEYWFTKTRLLNYNESKDSFYSTTKQGFERGFNFNSAITINTNLYGIAQFKKGNLKAIRHQMSPTISLVYAPNLEKEYNGIKTVFNSKRNIDTSYSIFNGFTQGKKDFGFSYGIFNNLEIKVKKTINKDSIITKKIKIIEQFQITSGYNIAATAFKMGDIIFSGRTSILNKKVAINFGWNLNPYILKNKIQVDEFEWKTNKRIGHISSGNIGLSTNLNPKARKEFKDNVQNQELYMIQMRPEMYVDFNIPWSLNIRYNLNYNFTSTVQYSQSIMYNGDLKISENWKIGFSSGYDFTSKNISITRLDIFRDLHCWEFNFGWIPKGYAKSFDFTIRVKSSTLQDLKLNRRRSWLDN